MRILKTDYCGIVGRYRYRILNICICFLKEILNEEDKFDTFIRELPQVKRLYEEKEMLMASNKSLAEYNLSQVPGRLAVLLIITLLCI